MQSQPFQSDSTGIELFSGLTGQLLAAGLGLLAVAVLGWTAYIAAWPGAVRTVAAGGANPAAQSVTDASRPSVTAYLPARGFVQDDATLYLPNRGRQHWASLAPLEP